MANLKNIFLSSMLGGVKGGTEGYYDSRNKQRDFALKLLAAQPKPEQPTNWEKEVKYYEGIPDSLKDTALKVKSSGMLGINPAGSVVRHEAPIQDPATIRLKKIIGKAESKQPLTQEEKNIFMGTKEYQQMKRQYERSLTPPDTTEEE